VQDLTIRAELLSVELDGDGLAVELKIGDGEALRMEGRVTSPEAVRIYRLVSEIVQETLHRLGKGLLVVAPIEPNDPDEEYEEEPTP
jgi:hypothetical protein